MKALPVIIGLVIILALVSLPGAAMVSKDDLLASLLPDQNTLPMFFCGDCGSESPYVLPEGTGIFVRPEPYDPLISKDDLIASYPPSHDWASMMAWVRGPVHCGDCTPESWSKGTVTPALYTPIPEPPHEHPSDGNPPPSTGGVLVNITPGIQSFVHPEPLPVTWYSKVATRLSLF